MFSLKNLIKQTIYNLLALAIIFCLSGMMNIVCCFAKCQIVTQEICATQENEPDCHESSGLFVESGSDCCVKVKENSDENSQECFSEISIEIEETDSFSQETETCDYVEESSCKMSCCLPSDEAVDITRLPKLDSYAAVNTLYLAFTEARQKDKIYLSPPTRNFSDQEKTYLKCCVFLI